MLQQLSSGRTHCTSLARAHCTVRVAWICALLLGLVYVVTNYAVVGGEPTSHTHTAVLVQLQGTVTRRMRIFAADRTEFADGTSERGGTQTISSNSQLQPQPSASFLTRLGALLNTAASLLQIVFTTSKPQAPEAWQLAQPAEMHAGPQLSPRCVGPDCHLVVYRTPEGDAGPPADLSGPGTAESPNWWPSWASWQPPAADTPPVVKSMDEQDECADEYELPKVALLFLTRGALPHEALWRAWFELAAQMVPRQVLNGRTCTRANLAQLQQVCGQPAEERAVLAAQRLFSVYVHPSPDFEGFNESSVFHGREVATRVQAEWGSWELIEASRLMLRAALANPANQKFVLLSESCVPLYSPFLTYEQLVAEEKSRLQSCDIEGSNVERRFSPEMAAEGLDRVYWRKSPQWFALSREHAEVVRDDSLLARIFAKYCLGYQYYPDTDTIRDCYSDEHYIPTLLAHSQRGHETDCGGWVTAMRWDDPESGHPMNFGAEHVSVALIDDLRGLPSDIAATHRSAMEQFLPVDSLASIDACLRNPANAYGPGLSSSQSLFGRKFASEATSALQNLYSNCTTSLSVLCIPTPHKQCLQGSQRHTANHC